MTKIYNKTKYSKWRQKEKQETNKVNFSIAAG